MTDPTNNPNNTISTTKRNGIVQAIFAFDFNNLKVFVNDETLINFPIHENGLSLLHLLSNINLTLVASKTNRAVNVIEDQTRELVEILLQKGYDSNIRDNHGRSALHYAASQGNNSLIRLLIQYSNGDVNPLTMGGETPLMKAIYFGKNASARLLLSYDPGFLIKNSCGKNALDIARSNRNDEMIQVLEELNARLKRRVLWIFLTNPEYSHQSIPYQTGLGYKQKEKMIKYL